MAQASVVVRLGRLKAPTQNVRLPLPRALARRRPVRARRGCADRCGDRRLEPRVISAGRDRAQPALRSEGLPAQFGTGGCALARTGNAGYGLVAAGCTRAAERE